MSSESQLDTQSTAATQAAATLVKAPFNSTAGPVVARNRDLCHGFLNENLGLTRRMVLLVKAAKDNLGNGLGMMTDEQISQFIEKFPFFHPDSTEKHDYFAVAESAFIWLQEHNMVPEACEMLEIGFEMQASPGSKAE